jgi:Mn-dependent DtxR family transcriptional regulator
MGSRLTAQDYLEAIYEMDEEGIATQQARVAEWLGVSAASVSEAVKRLNARGLVEVGDGRRLLFTGRAGGRPGRWYVVTVWPSDSWSRWSACHGTWPTRRPPSGDT